MTVAKPKVIRGVFNLHPYVIDYSLPAMKVWEKLPEKFPAEVIDNKLYVHGPFTMDRVYILMDIIDQLRDVGSKDIGEVFYKSVGVFLDKWKHAIMPDLLFISRERSHLIKEEGIFGPPDLIVEILAPQRRKYNFITKKRLYEKYGVKEYWIINPKTLDATGFRLEDGSYGPPISTNSSIELKVLSKEIRIFKRKLRDTSNARLGKASRKNSR